MNIIVTQLTSKDNPTIKSLSKLIKTKKHRETTGLFVAEGAALTKDLLRAQLELTSAFITPSAQKRYPNEVALIKNNTDEVYEISENLAQWVSDTRNPQGLFAVLRQKSHQLSSFEPKPGGYYILLEQLQDPGNLGTTLRTAYALGVDGAVLTDDCAELYSPKVIRSSMGAALTLPIVVTTSLKAPIDALKAVGIKVYATALHANAMVLERGLFTAGGALVFGNESAGLREETTLICDETVIIPMRQGADSLNVAVASGIAIWEMTSGRIQEKE